MSNEIAGSKEGQDQFVLHTLGHGFDRPRYFLDLGSAHPIFGNNTLMLEKAGWRGLLFDINEWACTEANKVRYNSKAICCNLTAAPILPFLVANHVPEVIDYISFDVDDATLNLIEGFPFDKYQFRIMTFEHDRYCAGRHKKEAMQKRLANKLRTMGDYEILAEDVCFAGTIENPQNPFEDWYVNVGLVDGTSWNPGTHLEHWHWQRIVDVLHHKFHG